MPEVTTRYRPGTPCWVSLAAPDQQAALDFYRDLFGWEGQVGPAETGGYSVCMWRGKAVAGISASQPMGDRPAPPTAWTTFLAADDADAAALAVTGNGGTLLTPVDEVPSTGRMFIAADPSDAVFGVWQALDFFGGEIVNEPGSLAWNELNSQDLDAATDFYPRALGVSVTPLKEMPGYLTFNVNGRPVGGMQRLGDGYPAGTPSHWLAYFSVDDVDSTVDALVKANGSVLTPPFDMTAGRMAVVTDQQGAMFAVIAQPPSA